MTELKGLFVDLDGTLVDTSEANFAAYQAALAEVGVAMTPDWWAARGFGRSWRQFLPELLADRPDVVAGSVAETKARIYPQFLDRVRVNVSLVRMIEALRPNVAIALVTTASRAGAEAVMDRHGLRELFDEIVTGDDVEEHKPSPAAYAEAARRLGVTPDQCLIIEDSGIGIAAARAFGASFLVVTEIEPDVSRQDRSCSSIAA